MNIPINKDFEHEYKQSFWKGFSLNEMKFMSAGIAVAVSVSGFAWLLVGVPVTASIYIGVPIAFPIILMGFYKTRNGLTLLEYLKAQRYRKATAILPYQAGEYSEVMMTEQKKEKQEKKRMRKMKKNYRKFLKFCKKTKKRKSKHLGKGGNKDGI